jgi:hypothetical protein
VAQGNLKHQARKSVSLPAGRLRQPIRPEKSFTETKKSVSSFNPLFYNGIEPMPDTRRPSRPKPSPYQDTVNDLTGRDDLPIFPATSALDSAAKRLPNP